MVFPIICKMMNGNMALRIFVKLEFAPVTLAAWQSFIKANTVVMPNKANSTMFV